MSSCKLLHGIYFTNWSTAVWSQSLVFLSTVLTLVFSSYTMICFYPCHPAHRFLVNCRKLWKASYSCNWPSAALCFLISFNSRKFLFRVLSSEEWRFWARSCKSGETKVCYCFWCLWSMFFIVMGFSCPTNGFQWNYNFSHKKCGQFLFFVLFGISIKTWLDQDVFVQPVWLLTDVSNWLKVILSVVHDHWVSKLRRLEFLVFHSISSWIFNLYTSSGCDKIPQSFRIKGWQNFSACALLGLYLSFQL